MTARQFDEFTIPNGPHTQRVARVVCRSCGVEHTLPIGSNGGLMPPRQIAKKLEAKGWSIGNNPRWDYCPHCATKPKKEAPALKLVEPQPATSPSEAPPRELTREDRRIIFQKLDEVYLDDKRGYDNGWSDQRVATDLGVPRAWVEELRRENFGDVAGNDEAKQFVDMAQALLQEARSHQLEAAKIRDEAQVLLNRAVEATKAFPADFGQRLAKLERAVVDLKRLLP